MTYGGLSKIKKPANLELPETVSSSSSVAASNPPPPQSLMEEEVSTPTTAFNVFDGMSESLDDEAFMGANNVTNDDYPYGDEYASQEFDTPLGDDNLDMDEEGFVMKGRTANYSTKEDVLICTAWRKVSLDATVGADQSANTYWQRIKDFFYARNTSGHQCSCASIHQRWGTINAQCKKWAGCLSNVDRMNPSGCGESDMKMIAQGLFRERNTK